MGMAVSLLRNMAALICWVAEQQLVISLVVSFSQLLAAMADRRQLAGVGPAPASCSRDRSGGEARQKKGVETDAGGG